MRVPKNWQKCSFKERASFGHLLGLRPFERICQERIKKEVQGAADTTSSGPLHPFHPTPNPTLQPEGARSRRQKQRGPRNRLCVAPSTDLWAPWLGLNWGEGRRFKLDGKWMFCFRLD